ncbi:hypothetical protein BMS91_07330 [Leuconostoc mesenteroides subsp. cremoris]|nr:hypothetical protein BMS91_07330 [Leuconostoc mesenteroides subsp. cremoris]
MKTIIMSIKPKYWNSISNGTKTVEFRKQVWAQSDTIPVKVIVYATSPIQKVVGEFIVTQILKDSPKRIWESTKNQGVITEKNFFTYFGHNNMAYAIVINKVKEYTCPKPLLSLKSLGVKAPPQSWQYSK